VVLASWLVTELWLLDALTDPFLLPLSFTTLALVALLELDDEIALVLVLVHPVNPKTAINITVLARTLLLIIIVITPHQRFIKFPILFTHSL